ncbi:ABC transporter permease [Microbacterium sp. NPDC059771]|uniref:ABC transporter permease n=1 Tax=unclassified Microbacterium TaxID=2609290 RepID=UPI0036562BFD
MSVTTTTTSVVIPERTPREKLAHFARTSTVYIALVVLVVYNLVATSGFATVATLQNVLFAVAPIVLIAVGQTLAIGTGGIDLSVGSVMSLSSAMIALYLGYGEVVALLTGVLVAAALGVLNGTMIAYLRINPLITSLGLLVAVRGLAQALSGGARSPLPGDGLFEWLGNAVLFGIPAVALIAVVVAAAMWLLVKKTTFGRYALFAGSNRAAAHLTGTPRNRTLIAIYALSAGLAGLAGAFVSARIGASDPSFIGIHLELTAIAAVVIGGTPLVGGRINIGGTVAAAVFLQVLDTTFIMNNLDFAYAQVLKAVLIVVALFLQRAGKDAR